MSAADTEMPRVRPRARRDNLIVYHVLLFVGLLAVWKVATATGILSPFFFGDPIVVFSTIVDWVTSGLIYRHLWITLVETMLAFVGGSALGLGAGLWLALNPMASKLASPYLKAFNSMPRVILAPIFAVWFGLGMTSKVALGITLVFFVVFFNAYQGVREVSPIVLSNARMLGATKSQLLRRVYVPSAMSWVFSSLHSAVGMAFVGAVIGEYMGSEAGIGYLILEAEGTFDINAVFAGVFILTVFAVALDALVGVVEKRLLHWQPREASLHQET